MLRVGAVVTWRTLMSRTLAVRRVSRVVHARALCNCARELLEWTTLEALNVRFLLRARGNCYHAHIRAFKKERFSQRVLDRIFFRSSHGTLSVFFRFLLVPLLLRLLRFLHMLYRALALNIVHKGINSFTFSDVLWIFKIVLLRKIKTGR